MPLKIKISLVVVKLAFFSCPNILLKKYTPSVPK
jgi:hypothetical protein